MSPNLSPVRIGIYGSDKNANTRGGCGLWPTGCTGAVTAAGGLPVQLGTPSPGRSWAKLLENIHGVVLVGENSDARYQAADESRLCEWCSEHGLPLLGIDQGLHSLNATYGGSVYLDLPRELPDALQHRHPPERGLRHAITVTRGTHLARLYGEGEAVVNSEHRRAVCRVARGFRVSARALDGVIEAIEAETDAWFALGVQWHPASATASGLDIQLFRGLVEACRQRPQKLKREVHAPAA